MQLSSFPLIMPFIHQAASFLCLLPFVPSDQTIVNMSENIINEAKTGTISI